MPNYLVRVKGDYEVLKQDRHNIEFLKEVVYRQSVRARFKYRKSTAIQKTKLVCYYCTMNTCLIIVSILYFVAVLEWRMPDGRPSEIKWPGMSTTPGKIEGDFKFVRYDKYDIRPVIEQINNFVSRYGHEGKRRLRECNLDTFWGYYSSTPCVFLKLNFALGFKAMTYDDAKTLPPEAPDELYDYILELSEEQRKDRIWTACSFDNKSIEGKILYIPKRFFEADGLFSLRNVYLHGVSENLTEKEVDEDPAYQRVIAIQFRDLPTNVDIYVSCAVWAKNIPLHFGSVRIVINIIENNYLKRPVENIYVH